MKRFLCVILAAIIATGCVLCLAVQPDWNGPDGEDASPTLCDTGRGYIVYYWYTPGVYYSPDGVTWVDLSDRQWVKDAASYRYITVGYYGHREFEFLWTGSEYMMRQSLRDDPRGTHRHMEDSPRNSVVTFLDEDFQIIGENAFDAPVTAIRYADGVYYATAGGAETAFSREDWAGPFTDVRPGAWYAPYVEACVEAGLMKGTSDTTFSPDRELSWEECVLLALRLHQFTGEGRVAFDAAPEDWGRGRVVLTVDGVSLFDGYLTYESDLRWISLGDHMASALGFTLDDDARRAWGAGLADREATLTLNGTVYSGALCLSPSGGLLCFFPSDWEPEYSPGGTAIPPAEWCRDGWYYAHQNGLTGLLYNSNARWAFAQRIVAVTDLPAINDIAKDDIPDPDPAFDAGSALVLYRAGVLTGVDGAGTFDGQKALTRAEAAAILARVLRPELRVTFTSPLPQGSATQG